MDKKNPAMTGAEKIILLALILGAFMTALDATIVSVALPSMAEELGEEGHNTANISWVLLIYTIMLGSFVLLWSKIGTVSGYRKVFMTGIFIFTLSSLLIGLCGFIDGLGLAAIIVLRAAQGIGAGMAMAMSLAMTTTYLPSSVRGSAIGAVTLATSCGTAFGPAIGGILTTFHWSYIFFINVPIGIMCLFLCARYIKVHENLPDVKPRLDIAGTLLIAVMLFSLIYYLNMGKDIGWMSFAGIVLIIITAASAGLLIWWEQRVSDPLLSMKLLSEREIIRANIVTMLMFMAMAGSYLLLPYYFGYVKGMETSEYGCVLIANSVGMMAAGPVVGKLSDRTGDSRPFIIAGTVVAAAGFLMMMEFGDSTELWYILLALFVMGAGMGMSLVASTNLAFGRISEGENGELSGQTTTFRQIGSSAGVAILNAVFMANLAYGAASVDSILLPGFRHAFFFAVLLVLAAFVVSMSLKKKGAGTE